MFQMKSSWVYFSVEADSPNSLFAKILWPALLPCGFSIRIFLLDQMELEIPTPVSHPPCSVTCPRSHVAYPPFKKIGRIKKIANFNEIILFIRTKIRERVWQAHFKQKWVCQIKLKKTFYLQEKLPQTMQYFIKNLIRFSFPC